MIPLFKAHSIEYSEKIATTLKSGYLGEGDVVEEFKVELKKVFKHPYLTLTNSCTSALKIAAQILDLKNGDRVISCPLTMVATNSVLKEVGCIIEWCDIDPYSFCADINNIIEISNNNTKAIVVTLLGGHVPRDLDKLFNLNIPVILDCAQAFMTYYNGYHISHWGDFCCFSFQSIKHLTTGDGGCLAINYLSPNPSISNLTCEPKKSAYIRAEKLKWFGMTRYEGEVKDKLKSQMEYDIMELGSKYHMNNISASIGLTTLNVALNAVKISQNNSFVLYDYVESALSNSTSISSCWVHGIRVRNRDKLMANFIERDIITSPIWKRNDLFLCFKNMSSKKLKSLDKIYDEILFIPNGWWVGLVELDLIVDTLKKFYKNEK